MEALSGMWSMFSLKKAGKFEFWEQVTTELNCTKKSAAGNNAHISIIAKVDPHRT